MLCSLVTLWKTMAVLSSPFKTQVYVNSQTNAPIASSVSYAMNDLTSTLHTMTIVNDPSYIDCFSNNNVASHIVVDTKLSFEFLSDVSEEEAESISSNSRKLLGITVMRKPWFTYGMNPNPSHSLDPRHAHSHNSHSHPVKKAHAPVKKANHAHSNSHSVVNNVRVKNISKPVFKIVDLRKEVAKLQKEINDKKVRLAQAGKAHSAKKAHAGKVHSAKKAQAGKAHSAKKAHAGKAHSSKKAHAHSVKAHSAKKAHAQSGRVHSAKKAQAGKAHGKAHSAKKAHAQSGRVHSAQKAQAGKAHGKAHSAKKAHAHSGRVHSAQKAHAGKAHSAKKLSKKEVSRLVNQLKPKQCVCRA